MKTPLVIAGAAALVVTAGIGVAAAASNTPNTPLTPNAGRLAVPALETTPSPAPTDRPKAPDERKQRFGPGKHRFGGPLAGMGGALHGEFVVPKKEGSGYQTIATQRGEVTAVSGSSITVKSADGYSRTYAVTGSTIVSAERDGIGAVKVGDQVAVLATVSGDKTTATNVFDVTQLKKATGGKRWFGVPR